MHILIILLYIWMRSEWAVDQGLRQLWISWTRWPYYCLITANTIWLCIKHSLLNKISDLNYTFNEQWHLSWLTGCTQIYHWCHILTLLIKSFNLASISTSQHHFSMSHWPRLIKWMTVFVLVSFCLFFNHYSAMLCKWRTKLSNRHPTISKDCN